MSTVVVVAPHPDDETLGPGGTLLRHRKLGDEVHWVIGTYMPEDERYPEAARQRRREEISAVERSYGFAQVHHLGFPTTELDTVPRGDLVAALGSVLRAVEPQVVYLPHGGDVHSDHQILCEVGVACTKWFRFPSVRRVAAYETLSETEFGGAPYLPSFTPNVLVDISQHLEDKVRIAEFYTSEMGSHPFPRSSEAIRAQAALRGAAAGVPAAEGFMLLREVVT